MNHYSISGYTIGLSDFPEYMIWDRFNEFTCPAATPQMTFTVISKDNGEISTLPDGAQLLVESSLNRTFKLDGSTHFLHTQGEVVSSIIVNDDYSKCILNIEPAFYSRHSDFEQQTSINCEIVTEIRKILTGRLALDRGLCIHSCVINFEGKGVLFSAVTKTGKSTHAHLWQELFPGTEIINGDNGFCRVLDGCPFVFGAPWCGDSNEYMNKTLPVRAIVFIERAAENSIEKLGALDAFMRLSARCYMPFWDKALVTKTMDTVEYMTREVACYLLRCQPHRDAVRIAHHELFGT